MNMQIQGKIYVTKDSEQVTPRFLKREFVLELEPESQYPQYVMFELTGDRCEALDGFNKGDEVKVEFSLRGREWTSPKGEVRYFNSLNAWSIDRVGDAAPTGAGDFGGGGGGGAVAGTGGIFGDSPPPPSDDDDIPF